jgi:hypothetical protein
VQSWFNQHSFLIAAGAAILILAAILLRDGVRPSDLLAIGALCLGLALAYALLAPGASTERELSAIRAQIGRGQPVLLEFQSPY